MPWSEASFVFLNSRRCQRHSFIRCLSIGQIGGLFGLRLAFLEGLSLEFLKKSVAEPARGTVGRMDWLRNSFAEFVSNAGQMIDDSGIGRENLTQLGRVPCAKMGFRHHSIV